MKESLNLFCVYDKSNKIIKEGSYDEVEDYIDNPDYTVVWNLNGQVM